jgi:hypothetical protein
VQETEHLLAEILSLKSRDRSRKPPPSSHIQRFGRRIHLDVLPKPYFADIALQRWNYCASLVGLQRGC